jgi:hypothetical protein
MHDGGDGPAEAGWPLRPAAFEPREFGLGVSHTLGVIPAAMQAGNHWQLLRMNDLRGARPLFLHLSCKSNANRSRIASGVRDDGGRWGSAVQHARPSEIPNGNFFSARFPPTLCNHSRFTIRSEKLSPALRTRRILCPSLSREAGGTAGFFGAAAGARACGFHGSLSPGPATQGFPPDTTIRLPRRLAVRPARCGCQSIGVHRDGSPARLCSAPEYRGVFAGADGLERNEVSLCKTPTRGCMAATIIEYALSG